MVVCKFFLQGTCKFGDFCKFEHQINDNFNPHQAQQQHSSILRQSHFGSAQPQFQNTSPVQNVKDKNTGNVNVTTLVKAVVNDMTSVEKGGQWLLSCYAPFKDKPLFPGFEDQSFEEVRLGFYDSAKNNTLQQYKQQIAMMLQQAAMKLKSLQNPSQDIVNILKNIYNTPVPSQPDQPANSFAGTSNALTNINNSTFIQQPFGSQTTSIFTQGNDNLFGRSQEQPKSNTGNIFGGAGAKSIFAGQAPQTSSNIFTNNQGQQTATSNVFGQANINSSIQSSSVFDGTPINSTQSFFTGPNPIFKTPPTNVFGNNQSMFSPVNAPASNMLFQPETQQPTAQSFSLTTSSQPPQQMTVFGMQSNSEMSPKPASTDVFGNGSVAFQQQAVNNSPLMQINSAASMQSANIFGSSRTASQNTVPEGVYSKLEELTDEEIKWFQSDNLDDLKIPEKPPTFEMCFKN